MPLVPTDAIRPHPNLPHPHKAGPIVITRSLHLIAGSKALDMAKACGVAEVETLYFEDCSPKRRESFMLREDAFTILSGLKRSGAGAKATEPQVAAAGSPAGAPEGGAYPPTQPLPPPPSSEKAPEKAKG